MKLSAQLFKQATRKFKLVIAGSGAGGNAMGQYFSRTIAVSEIAMIDPSPKIAYQPGYPLIGAGLMDPKEVIRDRKDFHPDLVEWYKNGIQKFEPIKNRVILDDETEVEYDFLVICTGCTPRFDKIDNLTDAFNSPGVCSVYDYNLAQKTRDEIQKFKGGNALFTHPSGHVKCESASQKICYVADSIFRQNKVRDDTAIVYNTASDSLCPVDKYADELKKIVSDKNILVNTLHNLVKVDTASKSAIFEILDKDGKPTGKTDEFQYEFLHVTPPCFPVEPLLESAKRKDGLTDADGWVDVNEETLQSRAYKNVFGLGDCVGTKNDKTAAAVSAQFSVVRHNLENMMNDKEFEYKYNGYSAHPFLIDSKHGMLAEFTSDGEKIETLPLDQSKPGYLYSYIDRYLLPFLYWKIHLKGFWQGPDTLRKIFHLGMSK